jgi:hypothetical protein
MTRRRTGLRWTEFSTALFLLSSPLGIPEVAALDWTEAGSHRWASLPPREGADAAAITPGFERQPGGATGIEFTNRLAELRSIANRNLLSGSGVAAGDVDGDGWCDLYFCSLDGDNALYRNLGGWRFDNITRRAGVACPNLDAMAAAFADIDGDHDLDLLVNTLGNGTKVFQNDGKGVFSEMTERSGLGSRRGSMSMALGDVDGNGTLDLYVANYRPTTVMDQPTTQFRVQMVKGAPHVAFVNGQPATLPELTNRFVIAPSGRVLELGEEDALYLNDGSGRFTHVPFTGGAFLDEDGRPLAEPPRDWSLAAQLRDLNADGAPDIYVCSDLFTPDRVWINDGKGRFRAIDRLALRNSSTFSMGVDFADINRDGHVDFFVTDMLSRDHTRRQVQVAEKSPTRSPVGLIDNRPQFGRNTLQLNRGDATFAEIGFYAGVEASEWSWGPVFLDVDLDGFEDLLVPNGQWGDFQNADIARQVEELRAAQKLNTREVMNLIKLYPRLETANLLFRNRGDLTFEEVGEKWGFHTPGISQGLCLADLDNDGDLDVALNNLNGEAGVYRNRGTAPRLAIRLKGLSPNTQGIGARIQVSGGPVSQTQEIICAGRYLSADDPMRVFAAGAAAGELTIEVTWRSGRRSVVQTARADRIYELDEQFAAVRPVEPPRVVKPHFEDVSHLLGHVHVDEPYDDFARQPLLPARLSQGGPGVTWFDVDSDGRDDLLIGSGKGGNLGLFLNRGPQGFQAVRAGIWTQTVTRDQTTILGIAPGFVLAGSANYDDGLALGGSVRLYDTARRVIEDAVPGHESTTGPMAMADVDEDGDLDLFVGGRGIPGRYPEPATSRLFRKDGGKFVLIQAFEKVGLVNGALFTDLDGDGKLELVMACDCGPIRVWRKQGLNFVEITRPLGLGAHLGHWTGVTAADFDGDGRMDLIAGNWGLNSRYETSPEHPRKIYFGDLDDNGSIEVIETVYDKALKKDVPERGLRSLGAAVPGIAGKWPTFEAYGRADVSEVAGEKAGALGVLEVNTLASTLFLNRGDRFEAVALPAEAQFAPVAGVCAADFDGDGNEDAFLSQNFFPVNPESTRCDAGRGLWLRGNGTGTFTPVPAQQSGIAIYGEQRGCAVTDYDADGRIDLAVTQNGNATKLYRNLAARPGLRVRLKGGLGNPSAIGAAMRLIVAGKHGPMREVRMGSGYWSSNGPAHILGGNSGSSQIWVRWPGGRITASDLSPDAKGVEVDAEGTVTPRN